MYFNKRCDLAPFINKQYEIGKKEWRDVSEFYSVVFYWLGKIIIIIK